MRLVYMGSPQFAVFPLECLARERYQIVGVYTQPDRPAGRGRMMKPSPVKESALKWQLPVVQPPSFKQPEAVAELKSRRPDVIVVAAFGQMLPPAVLEIPRFGCLNIHPSLLPKFRGASPVAAAILAGEEFTGVSLMLLDAGMDSGPLLTQAQIPISGNDTTGLLNDKLSRIGAGLCLDTLPRWLKGEIEPRPQNEDEVSFCPRISKAAGDIDWRLTAVTLWQQVRAFQPWPGSYTRYKGRRLEILEAVPLAGEVAVGQVTAPTGGEAPFGVGTGDGVLGVLKVKREGKRALTAAEFLRGERGFIGAELGLS